MRELTDKEVQEWAAGYAYDLAHVPVKGLGSVVLCPPSQGDFERWQKRSNGKGKTPGDPSGANEELVLSCLVAPTADELRAGIEAKRKHGLWQALATQIVRMSGALEEAAAGN